jgi:hypothetical protein
MRGRGTEGKGSGGEIKVRKNQPAVQLTKREASGKELFIFGRDPGGHFMAV